MNRFQKLAVVTTATTYLLILVGAFVRAAGAGMGCPDWPRCFDRWVPATELSQVPARYADVFNLRLAWIEYLNRLLGVSTGFLITATLLTAVLAHRAERPVVYASAGAFVGVGLAGWLGKMVVNRHLHPSLVTVHLFVALATAGLLVYATVAAFDRRDASEPAPEVPEPRRRFAALTTAALGLTLVQVALGTRVRASLEGVARSHPELSRGAWLSQLAGLDVAHRTLAALVFAAVLALAVHARRARLGRSLERSSAVSALVVLGQLAAGVGLAFVALPPALQVVHVALGTLLVGTLELQALWALRPERA